MYYGTIDWWNEKDGKGIVSVITNGIRTRYFLLASRILVSPEEIKSGDRARFEAFLTPRGPGLLPLAVGVEISRITVGV